MFNFLDFVYAKDVQFGVVVVGPLEIPHYYDHVGSEASWWPLNIDDSQEWKSTFTGYIIWDLTKDDYKVEAERNINKIERKPLNGYIPFDQGTGKLRGALGLIKLAHSWYGEGKEEEFDQLMRSVAKKAF